MNENPTINQIAPAYNAILSKIQENGGEVPPELEEAWDNISQLKEEKHIRTLEWAENEMLKIAALEGQIAHVTGILQGLKNGKERLENGLESTLEYCLGPYMDRKAFECEKTGRRWPVRRSESVEGTMSNDLPVIYRNISATPDKKAIKQALKEGKKVPGFFIKEAFRVQFGKGKKMPEN